MNDENDTGAGTQPSNLLTRAKVLPIEGVVYCLTHTAVHDDTTDPYDTGKPDCSEREHRAVMYRARKGDVDVVQDEENGLVSRVLAAQPEQLTEHERGVQLGLIRTAIRKVERNKAGAHKLFGDEYDPSKHDQRLVLLESAYRKLGGDPDNITNRPGAGSADDGGGGHD